jgi:hypothetical protein
VATRDRRWGTDKLPTQTFGKSDLKKKFREENHLCAQKTKKKKGPPQKKNSWPQKVSGRY